MRKILILCLVALFALSVSGCSSKTEYDKLFDEKEALVKKIASISSEKTDLAKTIVSRDMEIRDLKSELKTVNSKLSVLEKELAAKTVK